MVMVISAITVLICHRLHLPVVLGYILAGFLIGPHTPPYSLVTDQHSIHTLSTLGIIFLLFSLGLEFNFTKLAKVGLVAFVTSTFGIILMITTGFVLGKLMGWMQMDSLFLGAILSISSTTIIAKILMESKKVNEKFAQVILGTLVVQDLWAIIIIAILSGIATTGSLTISAISISMAKVFAFIVAVLFTGFFAVPRILRYVERFQIPEMTIVVVLGLCLGTSLIGAKVGFSIALGAFLIGAVISETRQSIGIVKQMEPIRDMFTAIFFVSVGMLIDPIIIMKFAIPILIITIVLIVGMVSSCALATFLTGYDSQTALRVGLGLAQIGEFSFIIAQLGRDTAVTSSFLYPIAVSVSAITTVSTPFLMNNASAIITRIRQYAPKPIVTFAHFYPMWMSKISEANMSNQKRMIMWNDVSRFLPKCIFYSMCLIASYVSASKFRYMFANLSDNIYWSIVTLLLFPFLAGFVQTLDRILWDGIFLNLIKSKAELHKGWETEEVFHNTIRFWAAIFSGLIFLLVASFIIPTAPLTVFIIVIVLSSGGFFWKSTRRIHENIEKTILSVMDYEKPLNKEQTKSAHDQLFDLIRTNYPLSFETQDVVLPYEPCGVNKTIAELNLRSITGASIVGIYRDDGTIPNPSPETKLIPGDVIVLIGSQEQLKAGMQYMQQKMKQAI